MKTYIEKLVSGKRVLILGFGREGQSTFHLLREINSYKELAISDKRELQLTDCEDVRCHCGDAYLDVLDDYDIVFKSPGIVLPKQKEEYRCHITSQTNVFVRVYSKQIVGVTGTKGKSTTSSLLYHMLKENGIPCILAGNIGIPMFDMVDSIEESTVIVLEMSCHQLELLDVSPSIAVFLNLSQDHLDYYGTVERYGAAKKNIYRHQTASDVLFCNPLNKPGKEECAAKVCCIDTECLPEGTAQNTKLIGQHNLFNIAVVYEVYRLLAEGEKAELDQGFLAALSTFEPLNHRLQHIGNVDGVDYYNDSISTTVESSINAMESIKNAGTILIGGMDRGIDYTELIEYLTTCKLDEVIFMYASGKRIFDEIQNRDCNKEKRPNYVYVPTLQEAVERAKESTAKGKACILSPAAASYGYFKNFEERGTEFNRLVFQRD